MFKMFHALYISLLLFCIVECNVDNLQLISTLHTDYLHKFTGYGSVVVLHFQVPEDTEFVSFKFTADHTKFSIFNCGLNEVILYMKHGSIPVINADESKVPKDFYNVTNSRLMYLQFVDDKTAHYINLTSPRAGYYYAAAFHPYVDPQSEGITQAGLTPQCSTYVDASVYVKKYVILDLERIHEVAITVPLYTLENQTFKFFIPEHHDRLILTVKDVIFCDTCTELTTELFDSSGDKSNFAIIVIHKTTYNQEPVYYRIGTKQNSWYYMQFHFHAKTIAVDDYGYLSFDIKSFSSTNSHLILNRYLDETPVNKNLSDLYNSAMFKSIRNEFLITYIPYKEYDLVRYGKSDSFFYSFDLHPRSDGSVPISINLTNTDFTVLKFYLNDAIDVGGTLEFILGFSPKVTRNNRTIVRESEPENHTVIACIRNQLLEVPAWPNQCTYANTSNIAPIILNKTVSNTTVMLPYPEAGQWYATLKLYCGECKPCDCPSTCVESYNACVKDCEIDCENATDCSNCTTMCQEEILNLSDCEIGCDCDGPCLRNNLTCESSVLFDISSYPCLTGSCGSNGRCVFMISQGLLFSTCLCSNNYKGWDCADNSDATPYGMVVLELCLLVLSNVIFVPAAYIAYRRKYYIEAIVYSSTFLSSTFYHACDAGENIISFCIVRLTVLQFSDFFSGLLSIWVTLIAMAYLKYPWNSIAHITGCIVLAFGTTYDKTSIWVFIIPAVAGSIIVILRWVYIRIKTGKLFPSKGYLIKFLPAGFVVVGAGLLLFALFQTQSNYKYIHSLWHLLMGIGVILLLPNLKTFLPSEAVNNSNSNHLLPNNANDLPNST